MTMIEVLQSAQFVVDHKGRRTAVLLNIEEWETLINWFENIADNKIAIQALSELKEEGGHPEQAGWLAWDDIRGEWNDKKGNETEAKTI